MIHVYMWKCLPVVTYDTCGSVCQWLHMIHVYMWKCLPVVTYDTCIHAEVFASGYI